jgi:proliferating cell nuclear antigen
MISTKNTNLLTKSLETITPLIQETNVRFKDEGIYIKAIDKTQILLVDFFMSKKAFDTYAVEPSLVGLNILELKNMLSRSFGEDKLQLNLKDQGLDVYLLGKIERKFYLSFLDISEQNINLPEIRYEVEFNIAAGLLKEILTDINLVASTIIFKINDGKLIIEATGEKGNIKTTLPEIKVKSKKNFSAKFSLSFLRNIVKSMDNDKVLLIKLAEDVPIYIEYTLSKDCIIKFYLSSMLI